MTEYPTGLVRERVGDLVPRYAPALLAIGAALRSSKAWLCATVEGNRAMPKRRVGSPKRRIVSQASVCVENIRLCEKMAKYVGSAYHKRTPGDYRFVPPASPRPNKSLCDGSRSLNLAEAEALFREGLRRGMYSPNFHFREHCNSVLLRRFPRVRDGCLLDRFAGYCLRLAWLRSGMWFEAEQGEGFLLQGLHPGEHG